MKKLLQAFLLCFLSFGFVFGQEFKNLPENPKEIVEFNKKFGFEKSQDTIVSSQFLDNETKILLLGKKSIAVWDILSEKLITEFPHEIKKLDEADSVAQISPDGKKVIIFDLFSFRLFRKPKRVKAEVFDLQTGKKITELDGIEKGIRFAIWSKNSKTLVTLSEIYASSKTTELCSWNGENLERRFCRIINGSSSYPWVNQDGSRIILPVNTSRKIALSLYEEDYWANLYNTENGELIEAFRTGIESYAFYMTSSSFKYLIGYSKGNRVKIWELEGNFSIRFDLESDKFGLTDFYEISKDEKLIAVRNEGNLEIYNTITRDKIFEIAESRKYEKANFSPDNKLLIADDCDKADVFDIETQRKLYELKLVCKEKGILASAIVDLDFIKFHPEGKFFLTTSDKTLRIWNSRTGVLMQTVINPENLKTKRKNKNADDGLRNTAGWIQNGRFLYAESANQESILIWEVKGI